MGVKKRSAITEPRRPLPHSPSRSPGLREAFSGGEEAGEEGEGEWVCLETKLGRVVAAALPLRSAAAAAEVCETANDCRGDYGGAVKGGNEGGRRLRCAAAL